MSRVTDSSEPDPGAEEDAELLRREREWLLERLREIPAERERLDAREQNLVWNAREADTGWDEIGGALGTTGAAALKKHGEPPAGVAPF